MGRDYQEGRDRKGIGGRARDSSLATFVQATHPARVLLQLALPKRHTFMLADLTFDCAVLYDLSIEIS
jgi:hypothetical protein